MAATPILPGISVKKPTCYGRCDGEVSANARGGFGAPYSYTWSGGRTTPKVIARCANDINLTITDAKGCILTTVATISQPSKVNAEVEPDNIYNGFAVRCPDSEDGQATVKPSGGAGGFSVSEEEATASTAPAASLRTIGGIDALIALQGQDDPAERRRRAVKRGRTALDALDELKVEVLGGTLGPSTLMRLKSATAELTDASGDPRLDALMAEIELRVEVEIAKMASRR